MILLIAIFKNGCKVDTKNRTISIDGKNATMRNTCWIVLDALLEANKHNRTVSYNYLCERIWNEAPADALRIKSIQGCIVEIRKKLGNVDIQNQSKNGYRIDELILFEDVTTQNDDLKNKQTFSIKRNTLPINQICEETKNIEKNVENAVDNKVYTIGNLLTKIAVVCNSLELIRQLYDYINDSIVTEAKESEHSYSEDYALGLRSFKYLLETYIPEYEELIEESNKCKIEIQNIINSQKDYPTSNSFVLAWSNETQVDVLKYLTVEESIDVLQCKTIELRTKIEYIADKLEVLISQKNFFKND